MLHQSPALADMESTHYRIEGEKIGPGGQAEDSPNYSILSVIGETLTGVAEGISHKVRGGSNPVIEANTPRAPTLSNPAGYYNKLRFIVDPSGNPTDCEFSLAITDDDWATIKYIQADNTVGEPIIWKTYSSWGGAIGELVTGLLPDTAHKVKSKARCGKYTESPWGPESSAATISTYIIADIAGTTVSFDELSFENISTALPPTLLTVSTNAESGYVIRVRGKGNGAEAGLYSQSANTVIASLTTTLTPGVEGYGIQASSAAASIANPYDGSGTDVGGLSRNLQDLGRNSGPVLSEIITVIAKATVAKETAVADYTDTLTFIITTTY